MLYRNIGINNDKHRVVNTGVLPRTRLNRSHEKWILKWSGRSSSEHIPTVVSPRYGYGTFQGLLNVSFWVYWTSPKIVAIIDH